MCLSNSIKHQGQNQVTKWNWGRAIIANISHKHKCQDDETSMTYTCLLWITTVALNGTVNSIGFYRWITWCVGTWHAKIAAIANVKVGSDYEMIVIRARTPTPQANNACICLVISYRCNEFHTEHSFWLNLNELQHWKSCQIWKGWALWERYGHTQLRPTIMKCLSHKISIWDNLCLFVISYMVLSEFALRRAFEWAHIWPQGCNIGELPNSERMGVVGKIMRCLFMLGTVIKCPSHKISIMRQFVFVCLYHIWC